MMPAARDPKNTTSEVRGSEAAAPDVNLQSASVHA